MAAEDIKKILERLEEQAKDLKELSLAISKQTIDVTVQKETIDQVRIEHDNLRSDIDGLKKHASNYSTLGATTFCNKVFSDSDAGGEANLDDQLHPPPAHSSPTSRVANKDLSKQAERSSINPSQNKVNDGEKELGGRPFEFRQSGHEMSLPNFTGNWTSRPSLTPTEYDGKVPWSRYSVHFDAIAKANGWNQELKSVYLAAHLRGTALAFYETLDARTRDDYTQLNEALKLRFGTEHEQSVAHIQLRARTQKHNESFSEYATDLQRLTHLAFADCNENVKDRIALGQFLDGIIDPDVQERVRDFAPTSLQTALQTAVRIEANHRATRAARRSIRVATTTTRNERPRQRPTRTRSPQNEANSTLATSNPSGNANELV